MFTTRALSGPTCTAKDIHSQLEYTELLNQVKVPEKDHWPALLLPQRYGKSHIPEVCLSHAVTLNAFRDFLQTVVGLPFHPNTCFINCTLLVPCNSAECEWS